MHSELGKLLQLQTYLCLTILWQPILMSTARCVSREKALDSKIWILTSVNRRTFSQGNYYKQLCCAGGSFLGSYVMTFGSTEHASAQKASLQVGFDKGIVKGEVTADFQHELKTLNSVEDVTGQYDCKGWSRNYPPKLGCSLQDILEAYSSFDTSFGAKMEGFLSRYSDIDDYNVCLTAYKEAHPGEAGGRDFEPIFIKVSNCQVRCRLPHSRVCCVQRQANFSLFSHEIACRLRKWKGVQSAKACYNIWLERSSQTLLRALDLTFPQTPSYLRSKSGFNILTRSHCTQ